MKAYISGYGMSATGGAAIIIAIAVGISIFTVAQHYNANNF